MADESTAEKDGLGMLIAQMTSYIKKMAMSYGGFNLADD
jgi:hypothetical protein